MPRYKHAMASVKTAALNATGHSPFSPVIHPPNTVPIPGPIKHRAIRGLRSAGKYGVLPLTSSVYAKKFEIDMTKRAAPRKSGKKLSRISSRSRWVETKY